MTSPADLLPKVRLLYCFQCKTIDELPWYDGPDEYDSAFIYLRAQKHTNASGEAHRGKMYDIEGKHWALENLRRSVIEQIKGQGSQGLAVVQSDYYDVRDTFAEDALKCYAKHLRPSEGCRDYHNSNKALVPDTKAERKAAGLGKPHVTGFLCDFCPVQMWVENQQNKKLYTA